MQQIKNMAHKIKYIISKTLTLLTEMNYLKLKENK